MALVETKNVQVVLTQAQIEGYLDPWQGIPLTPEWEALPDVMVAVWDPATSLLTLSFAKELVTP